MKEIAIIGGGPAGMAAAIGAASAGAHATIYEKNEKLGKKLYITGKGRCNLTNACEISDFFDNVISNPKFLKSAVYFFSAEDTIRFFEDIGLKLKQERGMRIFPVSDRSSDVIKAFERALKKANTDVKLHTEIKDINDLNADAVIIATGGLSYATTGSTGDGYKMAELMGHTVIEPVPALVPLVTEGTIAKELEGLSLKNISVSVTDDKDVLCSEFGEMLFTANGVSGPVILSLSARITRRLANEKKPLTLHIDLKPALDANKLDERILRDFNEVKNKDFKNSLSKLLPARLIPVVIKLSGIDKEKKVNEITRAERKRLAEILKNLEMTITGTEGFTRAVITQGGVAVSQINPSTMESKLRKNIYFAGEVIDVDALTGGFNIQIAISTGMLAGYKAALSK